MTALGGRAHHPRQFGLTSEQSHAVIHLTHVFTADKLLLRTQCRREMTGPQSRRKCDLDLLGTKQERAASARVRERDHSIAVMQRDRSVDGNFH